MSPAPLQYAPHPLLAPISRLAWTPVGTGRFPLQDMGSLFSNCLPFEGLISSSILVSSLEKSGLTLLYSDD